MATITIPHKFKPRDYQLNFLKALDSGITRAIIVWNRRSGKDKVCFNYLVRKAIEKVGTYYYFLPSYNQSKKFIWDNIDNEGFKMLDHIPKQAIKKTNSTELKIELINGSIIQLISADEFKKSGVGANPIGVVFSEYSISSPEAWQFVSPILAANNGWAIFNFTPRGKNHAWKLLEQAKTNEKWFTEILTIEDTKVLSDEALEEEKRQHPQDIIEQEYFCKFVEGAGQFFRRVRMNTYDMHDSLPQIGDFQLGVDLAKYQDFTVITPFNLNTFCVYPQDRFNQIDWNLQKSRIEASAFRYGNARVKIDATGVGDPVVEDLRSKGLNISDEDAVKFTEVSRMNLLNNLAMLLEQDKIQIPNDEGLLTELESFQYSLSPLGKIRVSAPEGLHDDRVMSLALAVYGITTPIPIDMYLHNPRFANREDNGDMYSADYN
jgi:hypothetical protein